VFGYKPSYNTINPTGVKPLAGSFDTVGVFARSVDDCALVVDVLSGEARGIARLEGLRPSRVGLWRTPAWPDAESATVRALETAAGRLAHNRITVEELALPRNSNLSSMRKATFCGSRPRACSHSNGLVAPTCCRLRAVPSSRTEQPFPRARYLEAQALIARCRASVRRAIAPFDLLLSPSAPGEAPAGLATPAKPCSTGGSPDCASRVSISRIHGARACPSAFSHGSDRRRSPAVALRQVDGGARHRND
jgi:amidase